MDIQNEKNKSFKSFASFSKNSLLKYSGLDNVRIQKFYQKITVAQVLRENGEASLIAKDLDKAISYFELAISIFRFLESKPGTSKIVKECNFDSFIESFCETRQSHFL